MHAKRYDRLTVLLHWLMAALILAQIGLGLWMVDLPKDDSGQRAGWFNVHNSVGMVLLLLIALRIAWLPWRPRVAPATRGWQHRAAGAGHALLYLLMLIVPLSGFLGSVFSGYPIRFFGLKLPKLAERWEDAKAFMSIVHEFSVYTLMLLIAVHVLAFAHHQFILKDGLIRRMR